MWTSLFLQISQATCRWLCCDDWDLSSSFLAQKVLAVIEGFRENSKITSWEEKARKCRSCLQSDQSTARVSLFQRKLKNGRKGKKMPVLSTKRSIYRESVYFISIAPSLRDWKHLLTHCTYLYVRYRYIGEVRTSPV